MYQLYLKYWKKMMKFAAIYKSKAKVDESLSQLY